MGLNNIERTPLSYRIIYRYVSFFFRIFYRRVLITGRENIPSGRQMIFASNHQNALMDALAMLIAYDKPVVFLARADMFKKKFFARLLYFVKILPVFRPRDGVETMNQNYDTFARTTRILKSGVPIAILPEGTHSPIKKLQPLKKGICRIAFLTAESQNFEEEILIVPVGIDYSHYVRAGTELLINYGAPVPVADYYPLYRENPQKAILQLRDRLAEAIRPLMIHVENEAYYDTYQQLLVINRENTGNPAPGEDKRCYEFAEDQAFIARLDKAAGENSRMLPDLQERCAAYFGHLKAARLRDKLFHRPYPGPAWPVVQAILSLIMLPAHLAGMIFNYIPYKVPVLLARNIKDKQFLSSLHFGFGLALFFIWYVAFLFLLWVVTKQLIVALLALMILAMAGIFSFYHYIHLKTLCGRFRFYRLRRSKPEVFRSMERERGAIITVLKENGVIL